MTKDDLAAVARMIRDAGDETLTRLEETPNRATATREWARLRMALQLAIGALQTREFQLAIRRQQRGNGSGSPTARKHWTIRSNASGAELGTYPGATPAEALDAMARDAGYRDHAHCREASGDDGSHLATSPAAGTVGK
jgi:hypothetical protein